ncbi:MAG: IspD/TarI family cytidylyltransferase [Planctomycetota bacterium]|jgi:2-C-methyl-D-erythritol 4-phosphate cytidylyltransferase
MDKLDLIVLAAGRGTRAKDSVPKQFIVLAGKPILIHGLEVYERLDCIKTKYVVCGHDQKDRMDAVLREYHIANYVLVEGGESRAASVYNGLSQVQRDRVITHNAVMPFVEEHLIRQVAAEDHDCVTTVTPLEYNLCEVDEFGERIVPRQRLRLINTPQSFRTEVFRDCHERARREGYVPASDTELMLHYGRTVRFVPGTERNFKITTPLDLAVAEMILLSRDSTGTGASSDGQQWRKALLGEE